MVAGSLKMWPSVTVSVSPCDVETPRHRARQGQTGGRWGPGSLSCDTPRKAFQLQSHIHRSSTTSPLVHTVNLKTEMTTRTLRTKKILMTSSSGGCSCRAPSTTGGNSLQNHTRITRVTWFTQVCIIPDFLCYRKKTMCLEFTRKVFFVRFRLISFVHINLI